MNMTKIFNAAWLFFAVLATLVNSEEYEEADRRLSESLPQSCDLIIERSRFYGTCCSLNATDSNGCVLNVANGICRITGQYWTKTWNSTSDRIECDGSEYDVPYLTTGSGFVAGEDDISPAYTVTLLSVSTLVAGATAFLF